MDKALTGGQVREGVVEDTYVVRSAPRSRGGDPELAAGGPTKRKERQGVSDTGNRIGKALTGRPSGLPVCRRPVTMPPPCSPQGAHVAAYPIHASVPPKRGLTVSPGSGVRA